MRSACIWIPSPRTAAAVSFSMVGWTGWVSFAMTASREIAAGVRQARGQPGPDRVADRDEDDRDRGGGLLGSDGCGGASRGDDQVDGQGDQLRREVGEAVAAVGKAVLDRDVLTLSVA